MRMDHVAVSKNWGPTLGCPCNQGPTILGSILGPLIFGNSHMSQGVRYFGGLGVPFCPFDDPDSLLKLARNKKGTLIKIGLLGHLAMFVGLNRNIPTVAHISRFPKWGLQQGDL